MTVKKKDNSFLQLWITISLSSSHSSLIFPLIFSSQPSPKNISNKIKLVCNTNKHKIIIIMWQICSWWPIWKRCLMEECTTVFSCRMPISVWHFETCVSTTQTELKADPLKSDGGKGAWWRDAPPFSVCHLAPCPFPFGILKLIFRQLKRELKADPLKSDGVVQFVSLR